MWKNKSINVVLHAQVDKCNFLTVYVCEHCVVAVGSSMGEYTVWTVPQYSPYDWNKPSSLSSATAAVSGAVSMYY